MTSLRTQKLKAEISRTGMPPNQKKRPRQLRSKFTLDVMLEAAEQLLQNGGMAAVTSRRVALRAGVGISTLYDYFPNRDAIVIQLANRLMQRREEEMIPKLAASLEKSLPELFKTLSEYVVTTDRFLLQLGDGFHSRYARFFQGGAYDLQNNAVASKKRFAELERTISAMLSRHPDQVGETDIALVAFLFSRVIRSTVNAVVEERPELAQSPSFSVMLERIMLAIADCPHPRKMSLSE